jgi:hypothetical protein
MDLLTVTCNKDKLQMQLQAESIQKYLSPCRHWVVINDSYVCIEEWRSLLSPYYQNHQLELIDVSSNNSIFSTEKGGWSRQQYYKFALFKQIQTDYLILDSKNFFIKPVSLGDWDLVIGNGTITNFKSDENWKHTIQEYSSKLNVPEVFEHLSIVTPFVFHKSVLDLIEDYDSFLEWFANQTVIESEFLFYSMLLHKHNLFPSKSELPKFHLITKLYDFSITQLCKLFFEKENIKVAGLHRTLVANFKEHEQILFNRWLNSVGLTTNLFG